MSYWKLKVASGMGVNNNAASATNLWANLAGIINGSITATSGLATTNPGWDAGQCYTIGTAPSSGIYTATATGAFTHSNVYYWYGAVDITKNHYAHGQVSGFTPQHKLTIGSSGGTTAASATANGFKPDYKQKNGTITAPKAGSSSHNWTSGNVNSIGVAASNTAPSGSLHQGDELYLIVNDTTLFMAYVNAGISSSVTNQDVATLMMSDFEFVSEIDTYMYGANDQNYPGCYTWTYVKDNLMEDAGTTAGTTTGDHYMGTVRHQYLNAGAWQTRASSVVNHEATTGSSSTSQYYGYRASPNILNPMLSPPAAERQFATANASGTVHSLNPMTYIGKGSHTTHGDPATRRLMNTYRTTDNFGMGDRLQHGSNYYRCFRYHNCGNNIAQSSTQRAIIAFPENNVAY
jgi:hypothetical protein|tara:strand:+ start:3049 stop:4263 length:1215 start_codon:yes stop_codon:yes gene_type:complete